VGVLIDHLAPQELLVHGGRLLAQCLGQGRGRVGERGADLVEGAETLAQRERRRVGQPGQQLAHLGAQLAHLVWG
jgi:hypothetical protein